MAVPDIEDFDRLLALSARVGADPALVQGAGGNTSLKDDGVLWIKASGTWLRDSLSSDIMVPVGLSPLLAAIERDDQAAEKAQDFVVSERNPGGLRPSIETTVHALMPRRIVVHVHCINTIALAVRGDAEAVLGERLGGLNWLFIPYVRPGLPLARAIRERIHPGTDVLILGNHGLVVAGDTVAEAEALLAQVSGLLSSPAREAPPPDIAGLKEAAEGSIYRLPSEPAAHRAASDAINCRIAEGGSLYPDHVIFLGAGSVVAGPDEDAAGIAERVTAAGLPAPVSILFPQRGVLIRDNATEGAEALARCLGDVTPLIDDHAPLHYLNEAENSELLNWDAEQYRQTLSGAAP